eukprot:COSAG04_NODE_2679_length_3743_cov_4.708013_1_plen_697_part_00
MALLVLLAAAAAGDVHWSDDRVSLTFNATQGGCLTQATLLGGASRPLLRTPLTLGLRQNGSAHWAACGTPATVEVLFRNSSALRLRSTETTSDGSALQTLVAFDSASATLSVVALWRCGGVGFGPTQAKQPYANRIAVSVGVAPSGRFVQDGATSAAPRHGFRSVGLADSVSLRWDRPKMTATTETADESVRLQLLKHGFTPAANEAWRLDFSLVFGSGANKEPAVTTAEQDVTLPSWLLPAVDHSSWWPGDERKLAVLRRLLPVYQAPLLHTAVSGCPTRFYPSSPANKSTPPFCQTFDGPTAAIAMARMGQRNDSAAAIARFAALVGREGGMDAEIGAAGNVRNAGQMVLFPAEFILAVWSFFAVFSTAGSDEDAKTMVEVWLPSVARACDFLLHHADPTTGWTYSTEDSFAPASVAVNALTAASRLCAEQLLGTGPCTREAVASWKRGARRASIVTQGLSINSSAQIPTAYAWFSPLKAAIARDEYIARWYQSVWPHFTGVGGSRNNDGGSFASGETSELSRSVFFNMSEQRRLMHGMYDWAWVDSDAVGVGGFIDTEHRWIPEGYSDRALWSMAEPAIYLTTDFRADGATVVEPHALSPVQLASPTGTPINQTVSVVVQERRGVSVRSVSVEYTGAIVASAAPMVGATAGSVWTHSLALPANGVGRVEFVIRVLCADGKSCGSGQGHFDAVQ